MCGVEGAELHERLLAAAGDRSFRHIGELTNTNPETVRRYMSGQAPSAEFLAEFCVAFGVSSEWLLLGRGPMRATEVKGHMLRHADPSELLAAMASTLEKLIDRVDRLDRFVQTLETRVRAKALPIPPGVNGVGSHEPAAPAVDPAHDRARRIGVAVTQRPRQDAG